MPSSAITSRICSRSRGSPWPEPYCSAVAPSVLSSCCTVSATVSIGRADRYGIPPASETTSGREATENSARISEAVMPGVRWAYEPLQGSRREPCSVMVGPPSGAVLLGGVRVRNTRGRSLT